VLILLAAGLASRYGSPKQLDSIGPGGAGIIDYSVFDARLAGFGKIVFVVNKRSAGSFENAYGSLSQHMTIEYAYQDLCGPSRAKPWGTAHALLSAADLVDRPFAAINADDFYGRSAFFKAAAFLDARRLESLAYGMLGYAMRDTLSPHGSVSRAVCDVGASGELLSITEHARVVAGSGRITSRSGEKEIVLSGSEPTSMNFWMLTPTIFDFLEPGFQEFYADNKDDPTTEFLLPDFIDTLVRQARITVEVVPHSDTWFGLTYREDRQRAAGEISELHSSGIYPEELRAQIDGA